MKMLPRPLRPTLHTNRFIMRSIAKVYLMRLQLFNPRWKSIRTKLMKRRMLKRGRPILKRRRWTMLHHQQKSRITSHLSPMAIAAMVAQSGWQLAADFLSKQAGNQFKLQYDGSEYPDDIEHFCRLCVHEEVVEWQCRWNRFFLPYKPHLLCNTHNHRRIVCALREAVLDRDWHHVGSIIGNIDVLRIPRVAAGNIVYFYYMAQLSAIKPYIGLIWRCGLQRLLQHRRDDDRFAKSLLSFLSSIQTHHFNKKVGYRRNTLLLSYVDTLVYLIARSHSVHAIQVIRLANKLDIYNADATYDAIFKAYTALFEYQRWKQTCLELETIDEEMAQRVLLRLLKSTRSFADGEGVTLLEAAIDILITLEDTEQVLTVAIDFCDQYPQLTGVVYNILHRRALDIEGDHLLTSILSSNRPINVSSSDPVWRHWAKPRVLNAHGKQSSAILSECFRTLIEMVDYAEHVDSIKIWRLLDACLNKMTPFNTIVRTAWADRRDWWPQFHNGRPFISNKLNRIRRSVVDKLDNFSTNTNVYSSD